MSSSCKLYYKLLLVFATSIRLVHNLFLKFYVLLMCPTIVAILEYTMNLKSYEIKFREKIQCKNGSVSLNAGTKLKSLTHSTESQKWRTLVSICLDVVYLSLNNTF